MLQTAVRYQHEPGTNPSNMTNYTIRMKQKSRKLFKGFTKKTSNETPRLNHKNSEQNRKQRQ
jgi:hypothetical protein